MTFFLSLKKSAKRKIIPLFVPRKSSDTTCGILNRYENTIYNKNP
jgi:hypothetical protein